MKGVQEWVAKSLVPIQTIARTSNIDIAKIYMPAAKTGAGNYKAGKQIGYLANTCLSSCLITI